MTCTDDDVWQLKNLRSGAVGPPTSMFLAGTWSDIKWVHPVLNGVEMTWDEFRAFRADR